MKDKEINRDTWPVILLFIFLLSGAEFCSAGVDPATQQLFAAAERQVNIFASDAPSLLLEADFSVQLHVPTEGHLSLKWDSDKRFWRRIIAGPFQQIEIRNGEMAYLSKNAPFTPIRVRDLFSLLSVLGNLEAMQIKKARIRTERGIKLTCFEVRFDYGRGAQSRDVCVDPNSREVLSADWSEPPDEHQREEFSDYAEFHGHRYPHKITLLVNGSKIAEVRITNLETATLDDALLNPPPGALVRRKCEGIKHPVPLKTPDPIYPNSSRQNKLMGDTTVAMTVLSDGSVDNIQLIGSGTRAMDDATLETLRGWKFKPAMCGSEPVAYDIDVVVSFRLYWLRCSEPSFAIPALQIRQSFARMSPTPPPRPTGPFHRGAVVIVTLSSPREKFWGAILDLSSEGLSLRGVDLASFDDLISLIKDGDSFTSGVVFFPMHRVERMELDLPESNILSLSQRFAQKTGQDPAPILTGGYLSTGGQE